MQPLRLKGNLHVSQILLRIGRTHNKSDTFVIVFIIVVIIVIIVIIVIASVSIITTTATITINTAITTGSVVE